MRRTIFILIAFTVSLAAANLKLYTKDGEYQIVREYKVEGDRVKFYSVERSEWEEVPVELVDLKRTESAAASVKEADDKIAKQFDDEAAAAKAQRAEIRMIPQDPGVYSIEDGKLRIFPLAETTVHTNKSRAILKKLSPLPVFVGTATLEIAGEHSVNIIKEERPEFFFQLEQQEAFAIIKLATQKGVRVVEKLTIMPVTNETQEERQPVEIFTKELSDNFLFKIWPQAPLPKGEYAVIEYQEGKVDLRLWDFRIE